MATTKTTGPKAQPNKPQTSAKTKSVPAIYVRSVPREGFRRAGIDFTPDGLGIALDVLTKEQLAAIRDEPLLVVEDCEIDLPDDGETGAGE